MANPSFRVGTKELFLPNVPITLMRSSYGPQYAKFQVPLYFSKLDIRDYLWHVYRVEIIAVRSYIKQSKVKAQNVDGKPAARRWHRPQAKKQMTVQLVRPFVWPEQPENFSEWDQEHKQTSEREQEKYQETLGQMKDTVINEERRERMREQAKLLLEGKVQWKPNMSSTPPNLMTRSQ